MRKILVTVFAGALALEGCSCLDAKTRRASAVRPTEPARIAGYVCCGRQDLPHVVWTASTVGLAVARAGAAAAPAARRRQPRPAEARVAAPAEGRVAAAAVASPTQASAKRPRARDPASTDSTNDGDQLIDCADPDCNGAACRAAKGLCDAIETCAAGACPADTMLPNTAVCRPKAGAWRRRRAVQRQLERLTIL